MQCRVRYCIEKRYTLLLVVAFDVVLLYITKLCLPKERSVCKYASGNKRRWSAKTIVFMGFYVAMNIVLTRFCSIDLGPFRLGFGPAATIMSGLWLGPLAGGVVGMVADLIGCLIDGYAINPLITVSAILWGVVPGAMGLRLAKGSTKKKDRGDLCVRRCCGGTVHHYL